MEYPTIQTTGTYDPIDNYFSISICPSNNHLFSIDGLTLKDMKELKSLVDILLDDYQENHNSGETK